MAHGRSRAGRLADAVARRTARERALELLYEAEAKGRPLDEVVGALPLAPDPYTASLVEGVQRRADELDGFITRFARGWTIDRMPAVDRAVLRLGTYELLAEPEVPVGVVLNEAVELAGEFSTQDSSRFVNGVLARVAVEVRPDEAEGDSTDVPEGHGGQPPPP